MTDKPAMTIEEEAMQLALLFDNCEIVLSDITAGLTKALTEAYARGRRDGLEEGLIITLKQNSHPHTDRKGETR